MAVSEVLLGGHELSATIDGVHRKANVVSLGTELHVFFDGESYGYEWLDPLAFDAAVSAGESSLLAPIPGTVKALLIEPGVPVQKGTALLVLEAMKMEWSIEAPSAGTVESFFFRAGDQVPEGTQLLAFTRNEGKVS